MCEWANIFSKPKSSGASVKAKNTYLANFKSDIDKLDIDKLKNVATNLSNLRSKVDKC